MLSRAECFRILEMSPKANRYEIETRYTMLIKRYRGMDDPETRKRLEEITLAHDILTGRYVEPEPEDPRLDTVIFGKTRRWWRNFWHYGRWPMFGIAVAVFFVGYLIYSIVTNEPADFQMVVAGQFATADDAEDRTKAYILDHVEGSRIIEFQLIPLDFSDPEETTTGSLPGAGADPQSQYAYVMKMMTLIAGDTIEMFITDKPVFEQYAPQGVFHDLTPVYERLQDLPPDILSKIKPLRRAIIDSYDDTEPDPSQEPIDPDSMNDDLSLPVFGLDVTELELVEGVGLYGKTQILTIGFKADDLAKMELFVETWIRDYEKMHADRKAFEDRLREEAAATATTAAATTAAAETTS